MKPKPIPPPIVEKPHPPPPIRAMVKPVITPPIVTIQPTKLPKVVPISYCQLMCLRYPYSIQCARCKRPIVPVKTPVAPPVRVIHPPPVRPTPPPPKVIPIAPPRPVIVKPPAPIRVQPPPQVVFNTMRCCYINHCVVLPIQPVCPSVCYEPCDATCTGRCQTNPNCPNKCAEVTQKLREYKVKFMIWLHAKLDAIKLTHRQMVEECILRTRAHYVSQIKTLQSQIKAAHPFLFTEPDNVSPAMRRGLQHGISINILGQQNVGGKGGASGGEGSPQYHVNQNIGISNNDPGSPEVGAGEPSTEATNTETEATPVESQEQSGAVAVATG